MLRFFLYFYLSDIRIAGHARINEQRRTHLSLSGFSTVLDLGIASLVTVTKKDGAGETESWK